MDYPLVYVANDKDAYPLLHIDDFLCALSGAKWFSTLDLASGYGKIFMDRASSDKATTVTPFGLT